MENINYALCARRMLWATTGFHVRASENDELTYPIALNVPNAATYSGLSRTRLYELIQNGELESFMVGGRRLILREKVDRFIEQAAGRSR